MRVMNSQPDRFPGRGGTLPLRRVQHALRPGPPHQPGCRPHQPGGDGTRAQSRSGRAPSGRSGALPRASGVAGLYRGDMPQRVPRGRRVSHVGTSAPTTTTGADAASTPFPVTAFTGSGPASAWWRSTAARTTTWSRAPAGSGSSTNRTTPTPAAASRPSPDAGPTPLSVPTACAGRLPGGTASSSASTWNAATSSSGRMLLRQRPGRSFRVEPLGAFAHRAGVQAHRHHLRLLRFRQLDPRRGPELSPRPCSAAASGDLRRPLWGAGPRRDGGLGPGQRPAQPLRPVPQSHQRPPRRGPRSRIRPEPRRPGVQGTGARPSRWFTPTSCRAPAG